MENQYQKAMENEFKNEIKIKIEIKTNYCVNIAVADKTQKQNKIKFIQKKCVLPQQGSVNK